MIQIVIFYGSFLVFPFIVLLIWLQKKKKIAKWLLILLWILSLLFVYSRFIERYVLLVHEHTFSISQDDSQDEAHIKIALFSDAHIGLYKGEWFLEKTVAKINELNPDIVLIAGDYIYHMSEEELISSQKILAKIKAPTYGVLGNHDQESSNSHTSGEFSYEKMHQALSPNIEMIDNRLLEIELMGKKITLAGIGSLWANNAQTDILADLDPSKIVIALMHNPDTAYGFPNYNIDLAFAGHTHGGQIRLPFIYKSIIPTKYDFDEGWYSIKGMPLFITAGTGEVNLPMRFLIPPRIDLFDLTLN